MRRRWLRLALLLVVWIVFHSSPGIIGAAEEGFGSLFNGRDLQGWIPMGPPDAFTVQDSAIYSTGARPYPSWLRSEREYENFVLRTRAVSVFNTIRREASFSIVVRE